MKGDFTSEFNSSLMTLDRINYIITSCIMALDDKNYTDWLRGLIMLNLELEPFLKESEVKTFVELREKARRSCSLVELYDYHAKLTTFANKKGLLLKSKNDDDFEPQEKW